MRKGQREIGNGIIRGQIPSTILGISHQQKQTAEHSHFFAKSWPTAPSNAFCEAALKTWSGTAAGFNLNLLYIHTAARNICNVTGVKYRDFSGRFIF